MELIEDTTTLRRAQVGEIARFMKIAKDGEGALKADYVALKRLDPFADAQSVQQIAALTNALYRAKVDCEHMSVSRWKRWGLIAHGIAMTVHCAPDKSAPTLGQQLALAGVSEARVTRLLNARGDAFFQILPRVLRLIASRNVLPDWAELGRLILSEGASDARGMRRAEAARRKIVGDYVRARLMSERTS
ncbi:hypothetical protein BVER_02583c [Candidatus Burkholderia verschuerenii]|uniref:CRISPR-associated protein, Cse2 family n=1 Tax=Candidatus Burkholderia verschuerenii TaxID=242163 RepID=A0A0L0MB02_9BURK|nr:type I-E CRISPR-associated protein Cse2/CasB [Candidatus Burkholderia verschuerenii]KND59114.1 hypothetical protein BVER_02583c [Candidatus Burkholderia verschuerenii]